MSWILGYLLFGFVTYFVASEMFDDDKKTKRATWYWNLAAVVTWPIILVWRFIEELKPHLHKGGVNFPTKNLRRPDPPPASRPDRRDR